MDFSLKSGLVKYSSVFLRIQVIAKTDMHDAY